MKLKWQQAPVKTQWGHEMVVASIAIDKDHTVDLYCEHDQTTKVEAMFSQRQPLTDEQVEKIIKANMSLQMNLAGIRADFEAAHGIKENT